MYRQVNELHDCSCTVLYSCFVQVKEFKYNMAFSYLFRYRFALYQGFALDEETFDKNCKRSDSTHTCREYDEGNVSVGM
jgi:hypothetical protein